MKILIKLGGTLLDSAVKRADIARQLTAVSQKAQIVVVHGGGKQVTHFLEERGIKSRFVNGLRVSDEAVIDAVTKVIAGSVNKQLVAAIRAAGGNAFGFSGVDGLVTPAAPVNEELQFVGKPQLSDGTLFTLLSNAGYLPVIACIAGDAAGGIYNVNADQMAVSCALGWKAEKLLFLTDVDGVRGAHGEVMPNLTSSSARELIASGVAHGGMQAKLESALWALEQGVSDVVVASGVAPEICARILSGEAVGTEITLDAQAEAV